MHESLAMEALPVGAVDRWARRSRVLVLLLLAPVCAEYLAAYDDSTGHPLRLLTGMLFFIPLYGCPALAIREVVRRADLGWAGMLLLAGAAGVLQAGVIDQSLFSTDYRDLAEWEAWRRGTLIEPLGVSVALALSFVGGHVIFSFCAPIAMVEGLSRGGRNGPWLGRGGLVFACVSWAAAAGLVLSDHLANESSHASWSQVAGSGLVVAALTVAAFKAGRRGPRRRDPRAREPRTPTVAGVSLVVVGIFGGVPPTWPGVAAAIGGLVLGGMWIARAARAPGWSAEHLVALAAGALLSRALLAFTYQPVFGEVGDGSKYAHNLIGLMVIGAIALVAGRSARRAPCVPTLPSPRR